MSDELALASISALLAAAARTLSVAELDNPEAESRYLLAEVLGISKARVMAHPEDPVLRDHELAYMSVVARRARHEPAAYITGHREFFGLDLEVTPSVLIPRPETELLVEIALDASQRLLETKGHDLLAADVGTGSGAVAIALAVNQPRLRILAIDTSAAALAVARRNADRHHVTDRIAFREEDLLGRVETRLDMLVTNLPYIPSAEVDRLMTEVSRYEPRAALDGGCDGTRLIKCALSQARSRMERLSVLALEIGDGQGASLSQFAGSLYPDANVGIVRDYAGMERVLLIALR